MNSMTIGSIPPRDRIGYIARRLIEVVEKGEHGHARDGAATSGSIDLAACLGLPLAAPWVAIRERRSFQPL
jgi:hypothetical protein